MSGGIVRGESAPERNSSVGGSVNEPEDIQERTCDEDARLPREPTRSRQFSAVLRKNYLLQTRSRRLWWSGAGWLALLVEVQRCCDNVGSASALRLNLEVTRLNVLLL